MADSYGLDENGNALCRDCRKNFSISDLKSCLYCDRFVCKRCATKSKRITGAFVCKTCKGDEI